MGNKPPREKKRGVANVFASQELGGALKTMFTSGGDLMGMFGSNSEDDLQAFDAARFAHFIQESEEDLQPAAHYDELKPIHKGAYKVLRPLGEGNFGVVLKVLHTGTNTAFAMKVVRLDIPEGARNRDHRLDAIQNAKTEIALLPKLAHPHIVGFVESFELPHHPTAQTTEQPHLCCVMEFVHGSDLNKLLQFSEQNRYRLAVPVILKFFFQLMGAIKHMHEKGVMHRDLKPDNVMVYYADLDSATASSMGVKLADFGVGVGTGEMSEYGEELRAEGIKGAQFFAAPEVLLREGSYDERCDVWSLGLLLHQMFFGISQMTYVTACRGLVVKMASDEDLRAAYCKMFNKRDMMDGGIDMGAVLAFFAATGQLWTEVLAPAAESDEGVSTVLLRMITDLDSRASIQQVLDMPIVRTWKYILNLRAEITGARNAMTEMAMAQIQAYASVAGVMTVLRRARLPGDQEGTPDYIMELKMVRRALYVLLNVVPRILAEELDFLVLRNLFERNPFLLEDEKVARRMMLILANLIIGSASISSDDDVDDVDEGAKKDQFLKKAKLISRWLVKFEMVVTLAQYGIEGVISDEDDVEVDDDEEEEEGETLNPRVKLVKLTEALCSHSRTFAKKIADVSAVSIVSRVVAGSEEAVLGKLLSAILPFVSDPDVIRTMVTTHGLDALLPFLGASGTRLSSAWPRADLARAIATALASSTDHAESLLRLSVQILHLLPHTAYYYEHNPASDLNVRLKSMRLASGGTEIEIDEESGLGFQVTGEGSYLVQSETPLSSECVFTESTEDCSKVVGYFEVTVNDGGCRDRSRIGFGLLDPELYRFMVDPLRAVFSRPSLGSGSETQALDEIASVPMQTGTVFGVGVLENQKMFYSVDGEVVCSHIAVRTDPGTPVDVFAAIVTKSVGFDASVNFGSSDFVLQFSTREDSEDPVREEVKEALRPVLMTIQSFADEESLAAFAEVIVEGIEGDDSPRVPLPKLKACE